MKLQTEELSLAKLQRRKVETRGRLYPPVRAQSRSLNTARLGFAPLHFCARTARPLALLLLLLLVLMISALPVTAQDAADTIRINTRVVFMDALVKDKKTGIPISDLKPEHFEVFDNGQPRSLSYFSREGQARKPLALVIILDLRDDGAGRFLKRPEVLKAMIDELSKLSPEDEVAIMAMDLNERDEKRLWLTGFTRDSAQIAAALSKVPEFIGPVGEVAETNRRKEPEKGESENETPSCASVTVASDSSQSNQEPSSESSQKPKRDEVVETETIKGSNNGATVVRTVKKDGSVDVKRVSKNGKVTIELDDIYDMAAAVRDATRRAQHDRPNSQASIVWISDGIAPIFFEDRDATQELLMKAPDAKGKLRKLQVSSRQGYYMSTAAEKQATAATVQ